MAHEVLATSLAILGFLLLIAFHFGPHHEVRAIKRLEAKVMLIPSAVLLFILAAIVFSGIIG